ncbi:redoxin domain-containing protein [Pseudarthrobacter sp. NIBRBAC000502770]|uniref:redoxin domain-containing protein n=1 Tax=Pseudarthrobacter sp. NIBRBAC000502770 TaxID=2590785 RepID=UPI0011403B17|nr:redoxin domain-containing protein [Pseudarthrobacter sp. NIBRBAC000502770]QDG88164.1 redoxin domain-containing protein [Pseudarthrobacter sp. NIBRBAC000502770]
MTLLPTQTAPDLGLELVGGGTTDDLNLGTGADGHFTLVVFYRGLHCPICRKQLAEIDKRIEDLQAAGIGRTVAVSMETAERSTRVMNDWHLANLPVAYGLSETAARSWGLNLSRAIKDGEPDLFNEPGIFILDDDGTLFWSSTATMPFGRPSLDDIMAGVRYAHDHDYPARGAA